MIIALCVINWTAVSAIITAITALVAVIALWQNKQQLKEMRQQWLEDRRARLSFGIISNDGLFLLRITNGGKETAYNISMTLAGDPIDNHYSEAIKNSYTRLQNQSFAIEAGVSKYFYLSHMKSNMDSEIYIDQEKFMQSEINNWLDSYKYFPLHIAGTYCGRYSIEESFCISDFIMDGSMKIKDELVASMEDIKKGLVLNNKRYMPIQKSLDVIAKKITKEE